MLDGVGASVVACPAGAWPRVLDFLSERLPRVLPDDWLARMARGEVLDAEGRPLPPGAPYRAHTRLFYYRVLSGEAVIPFEEQILFQDEHLLVADKPHFLPVLPAGRYVQQTLLTRLKKRTGIDTLSPIHRIDRETAGLVLFSLRPQDRGAYQALFRERAVEKVYEAIAPFRQDLTLPLVYRSHLRERAGKAFMQMEEMAGEAPNAETGIALIERLGDELARYELRPRTGKKHQLRAQLNALGLPIFGDRIYPLLQAEQAAPDYTQPLQLLARRVGFSDPLTGAQRAFESGFALRMPHEPEPHGPDATPR